jgi:hypothetical protein
MIDKTYKADADRLFPEGCKCGNNGGGDCDWCEIYYNGVEDDDDPVRDYRPGGNFNNSLTIHKE